MAMAISKVGKTYGLLTVLRRDKTKKRTYWICQCDCGVVKSVRSDHLGKNTVSCGCYNEEIIRKIKERAGSNTFRLRGHRLLFYKVVKPLYSEIKKRDNNCCVLCGKRTGLHIHHILRKSKYPELMFEPCNLITLCDTCHLWDAHSGNTNTINLELAQELLQIAFNNFIGHEINDELIEQIRETAIIFLDSYEKQK
jgi:hypothetical protein